MLIEGGLLWLRSGEAVFEKPLIIYRRLLRPPCDPVLLTQTRLLVAGHRATKIVAGAKSH